MDTKPQLGRDEHQGSASAPSALLPIVYSALIIVLGVWVTVATGEWIALVCAAGLLVVPLRSRGRTRNPSVS